MLDEHIAPASFGFMPYLTIFNLKISTYSVFMVLAFVAGFICFKLTADKIDKKMSSYRSLIIIYALLGGVIGAKLPILIYNFDLLFKYPKNINLLISGKTIIGALIGGILAVYILKRCLNINIKTGNDIAAPAALGMAIGRLGCFFGGCCYGIEAPRILGIDFGDGIFRYPTQLYEFVFDLAIFAFLLYLKRTKALRPGALFRYLVNSYMIFRFFIEFIRETDIIIWGLSYYQLICLICLLFINRKVIIRLFTKRPEKVA